ncbi:MAG: hypothetical protein HYT94_01945 [Parcubacteria group bacterium]|nr:hypothetical protein [Parcubacteria group bacterium]
MKTKLFFLLFAFCFLLSAPSASANVSVFLDPAHISVNPAGTFVANIRIDTEGECVNAIDGKMKFDNTVLKAVDFGRGQSLISLWIAPPKIDQSAGTVSFAGGIPGGYCGRVSGDPGLTNILGKVVFTPLGGSAFVSTRIEFSDDSAVLRNDGAGTPANVSFGGTDVAIKTGTGAQDEWLSDIRSDTLAPEDFVIELDRDPLAYDGKYFIAWSTMDKQSGIDHYEVFETNPWKFGFFDFMGIGEKRVFWVRAESPYILRDQNLRSKIMVKAVDKIGNERIMELNPETSLLQKIEIDRTWSEITIFLSAFVFLVTAWRVRKRRTP